MIFITVIYQPVKMSPYQSSIDASVINTFSSVIRCGGGYSCVAYTMQIYLVSTNALIYTTSQTLSTPIYDGQILSITVPVSSGMNNGNTYKWVLNVSADETNYVSSYECGFTTCGTSTLTISTITSPVTTNTYTFIANYTPVNNDSLQWCKFILYDNSGNELKRSDQITGVLEWVYSPLINNTTYGIATIGLTNSGYSISSPLYNFTVSYTAPNVYATPKTEIDCSRDSVKIYNNFTQINGTAVGAYSFGTYSNNTTCVILNSGTYVYWNKNLSIPVDGTVVFTTTLNSDFDGTIIKLENTSTDSVFKLWYKIDKVILDNTTNSFTLGTNSEYISPLLFKSGTNIKITFNGVSSGNIINPVFTTTDGTNTSTLSVTGTIKSTDRFVWDGTTGYINNIPVTTSGSLIAYTGGTFTFTNTNSSIVPKLELTYQMSTNHLFWQIGDEIFNAEVDITNNSSYLFALLPTTIYYNKLS